MFETNKTAIKKSQKEVTSKNYARKIRDIIKYHDNAIHNAQELITNLDAKVDAEKTANNKFRLLMLNPAVIKQGMKNGTPIEFVLNEQFIKRTVETWKDQPIEVVLEMLKVLEANIKVFAELVSKQTSKVEIKETLKATAKTQTKQRAKARKQMTVEGRATSKAVRGLMKSLGVTEAVAEKMVTEAKAIAKVKSLKK